MTGDKLNDYDYPCPHSSLRGVMCSEACPLSCDTRTLRRAHDALRRAVLGDMTAEEAARAYRSVAPEAWNHPFLRNDEHFNTLADVVAKL